MAEAFVSGVTVPSALVHLFPSFLPDQSTQSSLYQRSAPFSYSKPTPGGPKLHQRIRVPKVFKFLPEGEPEMPQTVHLQYNSPMQLYSKEAATEQFQQQIGANPVDLPAPDKHFDPSKSATLKYLKEAEKDDGFGQNFFEKVARAEAPNVPGQQEPHWARTAREKSERARSRTPADPVQRYRPSSSPAPLNHPVHYEHAREHAEKNRLFTHNVQPNWGPSYYDVAAHQQRSRRSQSLGREAQRGYELGGMDFTGGPIVDNTDYYYYDPVSKEEKPKLPPGYEMGGSDFYRGHAVHGGPYRGHGPDPPRLRPKYTADPHDACNVAVAPNLHDVDANLLVGDTLSNQKIRHEVRHIDQSEFGTSFGPTVGFQNDHARVQRIASPPRPTTFSLSARRDRAASAPRSSAPPEQQNVWHDRQSQVDKEVSIRTLLNDEALRASKREQSPFWAGHSAQKHEAWRNKVDPLFERYQTYISEPNWRRNVDQRRLAWERRAFETEQRLNRPFSEKVASAAPPFWHDRAARTHEQWQRQANDMSTSSQMQAGSEHSVPINYQYDSRQETQNSGHPTFASAPPPQSSAYATSQGDANVQRLLNSGYNANQVDYVLSHKDKFVDGQPLHPPVLGDFQNQNFSSAYSTSHNRTLNTSNTQAVPLGPPQGNGYSFQTETSRVGEPFNQFGDNSNQNNQYYKSSSYSTQSKAAPLQPQPSDNYQEGFKKETHGQKSTKPVSAPFQTHQESSYNRSYSSNQTTTTQQPQQQIQMAPLSVAAPQNYSTSYHTESHSQQPMMQSPGGQSYKSTEFSSSRFNKQETTTTTTTQPAFQTTNLPVTRTTTYNYNQRSVPSQPAPTSMRQESFTSHTEKTSNTNSAPRPQPAAFQYENYLSSRKEENRREETSRPVSQLSQYSESRNYKRNYEEKTETTTTPAAAVAPGTTTTTYKDLSNAQNVDDVFNKRTEMAEKLPMGSISNTHNNTEGGYRDASGHDVSYKRESQTAADPGKEYALLKEEEKRVIETPLEPGVISRHVTTKYYKKKTVTDTTTTTTPA